MYMLEGLCCFLDLAGFSFALVARSKAQQRAVQNAADASFVESSCGVRICLNEYFHIWAYTRKKSHRGSAITLLAMTSKLIL